MKLPRLRSKMPFLRRRSTNLTTVFQDGQLDSSGRKNDNHAKLESSYENNGKNGEKFIPKDDQAFCDMLRIFISKNPFNLYITVSSPSRPFSDWTLSEIDEMDDAEGMNKVGYYYENGIVAKKDKNKAFEYYYKAAEMGNAEGMSKMDDAEGMNKVGICYENGIGVKKDKNKAFEYYYKAAEMGDVKGMNKVGYCYENGIGVKKNDEMSFGYYNEAAEMGDAEGMSKVGFCYENGIGVEKDKNKAFEYYYKAAEMSDVKGMNKVGYYENKAFGYYIKSAELGDSDGSNAIENKYRIKWIPYSQFKNIREIGKGGFATIYYAKLEFDGALKLFHESQKRFQNFINEIIMQLWALHNNIFKVSRLAWKDKLSLLYLIASDLQSIHSQDFVHRDLHSGNVLQNALYNAYIADLGLSIPIDTNEDKIYEISTSQSIFDGISFDIDLAIKICSGLRPDCAEGTPDCYIKLVMQCMDSEANKRPNAEIIKLQIKPWLDKIGK
ncbi:hypothetical protein C2G38_2185661 [Gigaspora rosea]|uniref:Protein kinase domain-containing protein n=1 Tax=Gigaspora rosea TaxID=44941 RepID=A0A397V6K5_9GLOM|nr:hypothetical protein C2G38_2185661 [Gigaspora rosea]